MTPTGQVAVLTPEQVRTVVREEVQAALKAVLPLAIRQAMEKPYLTKAELMLLTGWSSRQVEYKKSKREIPFIRRGRLVLFPSYTYHGTVPFSSDQYRTTLPFDVVPGD